MLEISHKMNINLALIFTAFSHLDSCNSLNFLKNTVIQCTLTDLKQSADCFYSRKSCVQVHVHGHKSIYIQ